MKVDCLEVKILEDHENASLTDLCKKLYFKTKRYVALTQLKLGKKTIADIGFESV